MKPLPALTLLSLLPLAGLAAWSTLTATTPAPAPEKSHKLTTISPRKMADSLHAVIAADRDTYSRLVVQRLHTNQTTLPITTDWQHHPGLPVHAQMLRTASQTIQQQGAEFSYTLRSLWPINPNHGPQTEIEHAALHYLAQHPNHPYYTEEELGGRSYFTAAYPDRATLPSCIQCHNQHPESPRRNFQPGDFMGAVIVRIPLEF
jgi:hypothetical protein